MFTHSFECMLDIACNNTILYILVQFLLILAISKFKILNAANIDLFNPMTIVVIGGIGILTWMEKKIDPKALLLSTCDWHEQPTRPARLSDDDSRHRFFVVHDRAGPTINHRSVPAFPIGILHPLDKDGVQI